jgi:hypothetical protein
VNRLFLAHLALASAQATACHAPPALQRVEFSELVSRTKTIALAKVIGADLVEHGSAVRFRFETLRTLRGKHSPFFEMVGRSVEHEDQATTFSHHFEQDFWDRHGGRSPNSGDCEIYPTFAVGSIYLVFRDKPYHYASFERIVSYNGDERTKDKWLQYVEQRVAAK